MGEIRSTADFCPGIVLDTKAFQAGMDAAMSRPALLSTVAELRRQLSDALERIEELKQAIDDYRR